jgi:ABC-type phosphate transport system substrate-binding protein
MTHSTSTYRTYLCGIVTIASRFAAMVTLLFGSCGTMAWAQAVKTSDPVSLRGAGSTFAAPLYKRWIDEYGFASERLDIL